MATATTVSFGINVRRFRAAVRSLLPGGSPPAILGRIISRIVDAIYRQTTMRTIAHVIDEIYEAAPAFANNDPDTSVSSKAFVVWIGAALNHASPNFIFWQMPDAFPDSLHASILTCGSYLRTA